MKFAREMLFQVTAEIPGLLAEHFAESAVGRPGFDLTPDWEQYRRIEESGALHLITAREDGELVGYAVMFVTAHRHSRNATIALGDMIYLKPEYRAGRNGVMLLRFAEEHAKNQGCARITWSARSGTTMDRLLSVVGYVEDEIVRGKAL